MIKRQWFSSLAVKYIHNLQKIHAHFVKVVTFCRFYTGKNYFQTSFKKCILWKYNKKIWFWPHCLITDSTHRKFTVAICNHHCCPLFWFLPAMFKLFLFIGNCQHTWNIIKLIKWVNFCNIQPKMNFFLNLFYNRLN